MGNSATMRTFDSAIPQKPQEGLCAACGQRVTAHMGKDGRWQGCPVASPTAPRRLILVPDRRSTDRPRAAYSQWQAERRNAVIAPKPLTERRPQVAYLAALPLSHPSIKGMTSERDKAVYRVISRAHSGITAPELALKLGLATTRGIIESALQRLKAHNFIDTVGLE